MRVRQQLILHSKCPLIHSQQPAKFEFDYGPQPLNDFSQ